MKSITVHGKPIRSYLAWAAIGFLVSAAALYFQGCAGPPLKLWHNEKLTEDYDQKNMKAYLKQKINRDF